MREITMIEASLAAIRGQTVVVKCRTFHDSRTAFEGYCYWLTKRGVDFHARKSVGFQDVLIDGSTGTIRFTSSNHQLDGVLPENVIYDGYGKSAPNRR